MSEHSKKILRERILTLLRNQEEEERLNKSLAISQKLFQMQEFREAETILFYASFDGEVETFNMIKSALQQGKSVQLPRMTGLEGEFAPMPVYSLEDDLEAGPYGIKQPKAKDEFTSTADDLDIVIVPGVAFDKNNNRLGRGGGYYDRFLKTVSPTTKTVGLAFDFQIVDSLSCQEEHDVSVSCVLTN